MPDLMHIECAVCHLTSSAHPFVSYDLGFGHIVLCEDCCIKADIARELRAA